MNEKSFKNGFRVVLKCSKCEDKVHSRYSGHFKPCKCGLIFVDQTEHYCRIGASPDSFTEEEVYFKEYDRSLNEKV